MTKVMDICPYCGSHLIVKDGQFGEFLACPRFPACRYTKPFGDEIALYKPPSPYCKKCNHTGFLPFIKNGRVIANAFIDCECKPPEHFDPARLQPEDFDFPCSYDFRRWVAWEYKDFDLPPIEPIREPEILPIIPPEHKLYDRLQQTEGKLVFLQNKLNEHLDKKKKDFKYK